jgi:hypothetical protein
VDNGPNTQGSSDAKLGDFEQYLVSQNGRRYDVYDLRTTKGKRVVMFFDIGKEEAPSPTATIPNLDTNS